MPRIVVITCILITCAMVAACGESAKLPPTASEGPNPQIPPPVQTLLPTVDIAPAKGWPEGAKPTAAAGLTVTAFATGLDHPRSLLVLPNGDVLVAETNGPERPDDVRGIRGIISKQVQNWAGAGGKSADRITLLRDSKGEGIADTRTAFLTGLNSPFGMALVGNDLYVANTDAIIRFSYSGGDMEIRSSGEKVADLPGGTLNHHWTKGLIASTDGTHLYASIGSNSNVGENGLDKEQGRAAIREVDPSTGHWREYASGLRNAVAMAIEPQTKALWTVVNERDELGSDLVPDYLTAVKDGAFYGWPFSYWGQHVDTRVKPENPQMVENAVVPDYALGNHVAPLGVAFARGNLLPENLRNGAFIGEHGSWNRKPLSGYQVVFVPFANGKPSGLPQAILTGFVSPDGKAFGRPVGVTIDKTGALLVADDVGNTVWRVAPTQAQASRKQ